MCCSFGTSKINTPCIRRRLRRLTSMSGMWATRRMATNELWEWEIKFKMKTKKKINIIVWENSIIKWLMKKISNLITCLAFFIVCNCIRFRTKSALQHKTESEPHYYSTNWDFTLFCCCERSKIRKAKASQQQSVVSISTISTIHTDNKQAMWTISLHLADVTHLLYN